jgi:hypothetical protein
MVSMTAAAHRAAATAALVSVILTGLACTGAQPSRASAAAGGDLTTPAQARLVDRVPAPVLHWRTCRKIAQCATASLPLGYRHPHGATVRLALLRIPAPDRRHRLGSLFVNPGGPGDSARDFAFSAQIPPSVPRKILDCFDIVGVDPRGVGGSTPDRRHRAVAPRAGRLPWPVPRAGRAGPAHRAGRGRDRPRRRRPPGAAAARRAPAGPGSLRSPRRLVRGAVHGRPARGGRRRLARRRGGRQPPGTVLRRGLRLGHRPVRHPHLDRAGPQRLPRPVQPAHVRAGAADRRPVGSGDQLRQRRPGVPPAAPQPPDRQQQLGPHRPADVGLRGPHGLDYLLRPQAPAPKITRCRGDVQPFAPGPAGS